MRALAARGEVVLVKAAAGAAVPARARGVQAPPGARMQWMK